MLFEAVIVEDDRFAREDLSHMLKAFKEIRLIGYAEDLGGARALLHSCEPDVVFLDVHLKGGSGLDLVPDIHPAAGIIFLTAHDRYAVRAFEVNALDYLLKPLDEVRLGKAIARLKNRPSARDEEPMIPAEPDDRLLVTTPDKRMFVPVREISAVKSIGGNYLEMYLRRQEPLVIRKTMKVLEDTLPASSFMRVHRSAIVNTSHIWKLERAESGNVSLFLEGIDLPFPVSRQMAGQLKKNMEMS